MLRVFIIIILGSLYFSGFACTNFLITKGASTEGTPMISYSADSHVLYGELYHWPAAIYPEGAMLDIYEWDTGKLLGKISQARQTYNVVGNMNEYQVAIGETTYGGREELHVQPGAIMDYGSLIYVALQRSKTAREAIKVIAELMAEYGYASEGESFSIMDKNEVWIMEMIGKGKFGKGAVWVAMMVPDGYICGHANQARIMQFPRKYKDGAISSKEMDKIFDPKVNVVYAEDVVSFAKNNGFYSGEDKDFSFSDVYAPVDFGGARFCEARVWSMFRQVNSGMDKYESYAMGNDLKNRMPLFIKPERKISLNDMMAFMGDHYEGTKMDFSKDIGAGAYESPYRWRPMTWQIDSVGYFNERSTSTQQTGFTFIAQGRDKYPDPVGGILWFGVDDSYFTVYNPMFCGITEVPQNYREGYGSMIEFNPNAAFWVFNQVSNFAYTRYSAIAPIVKEHQKELTDKFLKELDPISETVAKIYATDPALALDFITNYSNREGENTVKHWQKLYGFLFSKFVDGNVKKTEGMKLLDNGNGKNIPPSPSQPGYSEKLLRSIINQTGERYKAK
jgi:dipeptidase